MLYLFTVVMLGGTIPTPLYSFYAETLGLTPLLVTVVFAAYAVGTLVALLLLGGLSDQIGRRRVLLTGVAVATASALVFLAPVSLATLLVARLLSGLSVGLVTGTATAYLTELDPNRRRAAALATAANMGGLGLGPLLSGILAEHAPWPTRLPYAVFLGLLAISPTIFRVPETVTVVQAVTLRPQRLSLPAGQRARFTAAALASFAAFAVLGLFTSLTSTFVAKGLHNPSHQVVGLVVFAQFAAGTVGQLGQSRLGPRTATAVGLAILPVGLLLIIIALPVASLALFALGAVIGGAGVGLAFRAGLVTVGELAPPDRRGEVTSSLFVVAYSGLVLPVIGVGLLVTETSLLTAAITLGALVTVLVAAAAALNRSARQIEREPDPLTR